MTYQLSFLAPINGNSNRRPRQRQSESWESYCIRDETWRRVNTIDKTPEQRRQAIANNEMFRERLLRATEIFCYRLRERAKKQQLPGAVFFWFGGELGYPGPQSQYVNQATLDFILKHCNTNPPRRGKIRVSFGPCLGVIKG